jgi:single-strand DNA-binding protein
MSGFQKFIALGNLTKDAESRQAGENEVAKFGIAVNGYKDSVEFFDCEYWKPGGVLQYLTRGTQVLVEGEIQTQTWDSNGEKKSRKIVRVLKVQLCGGGKRREEELEPAFSDFR